MARILALALAVLTGVVAIFAIWANDQLLDPGGWAAVSGRLLEDRQVRHRVATFLGDELVAQTEARLDAAGEEAVAAEVMPRLRAERTALAERTMGTRSFRRVWAQANRSGHRALLHVLDEEGTGPVVVDLTPALRRVADELGESGLARELGVAELGSLVQPGAARIKVLEARELSAAQNAVRVVRDLTVPAVVATLALYLLALFLGRRRPSLAFLGVGLALVATGILALLARALAGHQVVDRLLGAPADREAADAAWTLATSRIADLAGWAIGIGIAVALLAAALAVVHRRGRFRGEGAAG